MLKKIKLWWWKKTHVIEPIKITDTKVESIYAIKKYILHEYNSMSNEKIKEFVIDDLAYDIGKNVLKDAGLIFVEPQFDGTIKVEAQVKVVAR